MAAPTASAAATAAGVAFRPCASSKAAAAMRAAHGRAWALGQSRRPLVRLAAPSSPPPPSALGLPAPSVPAPRSAPRLFLGGALGPGPLAAASASAARSAAAAAAASAGWTAARQRRHFGVRAEPTPNPDSVMFHPDFPVLGEGTKTMRFTNKYETSDSPLAAAIFKVKGVSEVMLASGHVTVTKSPAVEWDFVQPNIEVVIGQFYAAGLEVVREGVVDKEEGASKLNFDPDSVEGQILELLEERVRPFVQQDGGDVEFHSFEHHEGILTLKMHGACAGCPKSNVTLQIGIKNLMEHYIPEVKEVVPLEEDDEELPRGHNY